MLLYIIGQAAQSFGPHGQAQDRMGLQPAADMAVLYLVLHIAGDDAAEEEEHPVLQAYSSERLCQGCWSRSIFSSRFTGYQLGAEELFISPGE
jgi:hypothetical protein